jgi:hypothetical protein
VSEISEGIRQSHLPQVKVFDIREIPDGGIAMEFRLVYRGPLSARIDHQTQHKHDIRKYFHPQLAELWKQHAGLRALSESGKPFKHKKEPQRSLSNKNGHVYKFLYLIGEKHGISCALDILFLRRESSGGLVKHGGDIDNRLKNLFDALKAPREDGELPDVASAPDENPFFCVLDDDKFIDKLTITTDRLLLPVDTVSGERETDVLLVINVKTLIFDSSLADWWAASDR